MSHPVWVRGLKQCKIISKRFYVIVAPRVGAWIETGFHSISTFRRALSHPVWVRGLKHDLSDPQILDACRTPCGCVD